MLVSEANQPVFSPQVVLVSATLPHEILEMTNKFMTDPVRILVKRDELTLEVRLSIRRFRELLEMRRVS